VDEADLGDLPRRAAQIEAELKLGRRVAVTNNGVLLGYLVPAEFPPFTTFEQLVAAGQVRRATGNLLDHLDPEPAEPGEESLGDFAVRMRDEERY
jgi:hypothetical protein